MLGFNSDGKFTVVVNLASTVPKLTEKSICLKWRLFYKWLHFKRTFSPGKNLFRYRFYPAKQKVALPIGNIAIEIFDLTCFLKKNDRQRTEEKDRMGRIRHNVPFR